MSLGSKENVRLAARISFVLTTMSMFGCVSLDQLAPPVSEDWVEVAKGYGFGLETLSRGRQIYLTRCIQCHNLEPIQRYSQAQWQAIVPEMAVEAKINASQTSDLLAYLLTARRIGPSDPKSHRKAVPIDNTVSQSPSS